MNILKIFRATSVKSFGDRHSLEVHFVQGRLVDGMQIDFEVFVRLIHRHLFKLYLLVQHHRALDWVSVSLWWLYIRVVVEAWSISIRLHVWLGHLVVVIQQSSRLHWADRRLVTQQQLFAAHLKLHLVVNNIFVFKRTNVVFSFEEEVFSFPMFVFVINNLLFLFFNLLHQKLLFSLITCVVLFRFLHFLASLFFDEFALGV